MIIALGLGKNNALTLRVRALFLPSPRAIIMFVWPLQVIFLLYTSTDILMCIGFFNYCCLNHHINATVYLAWREGGWADFDNIRERSRAQNSLAHSYPTKWNLSYQLKCKPTIYLMKAFPKLEAVVWSKQDLQPIGGVWIYLSGLDRINCIVRKWQYLLKRYKMQILYTAFW